MICTKPVIFDLLLTYMLKIILLHDIQLPYLLQCNLLSLKLYKTIMQHYKIPNNMNCVTLIKTHTHIGILQMNTVGVLQLLNFQRNIFI